LNSYEKELEILKEKYSQLSSQITEKKKISLALKNQLNEASILISHKRPWKQLKKDSEKKNRRKSLKQSIFPKLNSALKSESLHVKAIILEDEDGKEVVLKGLPHSIFKTT
jgi:superoxide dismutase